MSNLLLVLHTDARQRKLFDEAFSCLSSFAIMCSCWRTEICSKPARCGGDRSVKYFVSSAHNVVSMLNESQSERVVPTRSLFELDVTFVYREGTKAVGA